MAHFQNQTPHPVRPPIGQHSQTAPIRPPYIPQPGSLPARALPNQQIRQPVTQSTPIQGPMTDQNVPQLTNDLNTMNLGSQKSGRSRRAYAATTPVQQQSGQPAQTSALSNVHTPLGLPPRQAKKARIDPNMIPSPIESQMQDMRRCERSEYYYGTCSSDTMPLSTTDFKCIDQGNCNPRFMRATVKEVPNDINFIRDTGLPFGLVIQPLSRLHPEDAILPVVGQPTNTDGPVRCHRCKGYLNPWCQYTDAGKKFICNLCEYPNAVPEHQFCPVDSITGRRMDIESHPELTYGSVDFQVPQEYWLGVEPRPMHYLLAIDVSRHANSMLKPFCDMLKDMVNSGSFQHGTKIGIITFDDNVHFYNLQSTQDSATMMVVSDVDDIFVPISEGIFVDPSESRVVINKLLDQIPVMFQVNTASGSVFGSATKAIKLAMKDYGGKVILTQTSLPTFGPGTLKNRDDPTLYACEREKSLFTPQINYYTELANDFVQTGISVDLWFFPPANTYIDIATIGVLSALTGGDTHYFPNFGETYPLEEVYHDLKKSIQREHGYRATMRIRCSNGISVANHYGNFSMSNATDIDLAGISEDTSIGVELKLDGNSMTDNTYVQCAVLYTTPTGERRLRVHNLKLGVAKTVASLFKGADLDASICLLTKQFVALSAKKSLGDLSKELDELCVKILLSYRKYVTPQASPAQLVLPETVKTLPLLLSSFKKSLVLRKDSSVNPDIRVYSMRRMKSASVKETMRWLYPQMIKIHEWIAQEDKSQLPLERLSYDRLDPLGIYWIETHNRTFLWLGKDVSSELLKHVTGNLDLDKINPQMKCLPKIEESVLKNPLWILYNNMALNSASLPKFQLIRHSLDLEVELSSVMVEDEVYSQMDYSDYLCEIHKQIKQELERETQQTAISAASYWAYRY